MALTCQWHRCSSSEAGSDSWARAACREERARPQRWHNCWLHTAETWSHPTRPTCTAVCVSHGSRQSTQPVPTCIQPVPTYIQPVPTCIQPVPIYIQPVPTCIQPVPACIQPVPTCIRYISPRAWQLTHEKPQLILQTTPCHKISASPRFKQT